MQIVVKQTINKTKLKPAMIGEALRKSKKILKNESTKLSKLSEYVFVLLKKKHPFKNHPMKSNIYTSYNLISVGYNIKDES